MKNFCVSASPRLITPIVVHRPSSVVPSSVVGNRSRSSSAAVQVVARPSRSSIVAVLRRQTTVVGRPSIPPHSRHTAPYTRRRARASAGVTRPRRAPASRRASCAASRRARAAGPGGPKPGRVVLGEEAVARAPEFDVHAARSPGGCSARPGGRCARRAPARSATRPRECRLHQSTSSAYMKKPSSNPPTCAYTARRISMAAPSGWSMGKGAGAAALLRRVAPVEAAFEQPGMQRKEVEEDLGQARKAEGVTLQAAVAVAGAAAPPSPRWGARPGTRSAFQSRPVRRPYPG